MADIYNPKFKTKQIFNLASSVTGQPVDGEIFYWVTFENSKLYSNYRVPGETEDRKYLITDPIAFNPEQVFNSKVKEISYNSKLQIINYKNENATFSVPLEKLLVDGDIIFDKDTITFPVSQNQKKSVNVPEELKKHIVSGVYFDKKLKLSYNTGDDISIDMSNVSNSVTYNDSNTISFSVSGNTLTSSVKISKEQTNQLQVKSDGLYVPNILKNIQFIRPVSDAGLYPVVEISDSADFSNFEKISGNSENAKLFKVFDGSIWTPLPTDCQLGTPYDGMPVTVEIWDFCKEKFPDTLPPYYVRYYWVDVADGTSSNKQATIFPSTTTPEPFKYVSNSIAPDSQSFNIIVCDSKNTVQASTIILGDGLKVISGKNGSVTIAKDRREKISFTASDIVDNKLTVNGALVCDFAVIDNDGVMVLPAIQQSGENVVIDFEDWEITGTWNIVFR